MASYDLKMSQFIDLEFTDDIAKFFSKHRVNSCWVIDHSRHADVGMHVNLRDLPYMNDIMIRYILLRVTPGLINLIEQCQFSRLVLTFNDLQQEIGTV